MARRVLGMNSSATPQGPCNQVYQLFHCLCPLDQLPRVPADLLGQVTRHSMLVIVCFISAHLHVKGTWRLISNRVNDFVWSGPILSQVLSSCCYDSFQFSAVVGFVVNFCFGSEQRSPYS